MKPNAHEFSATLGSLMLFSLVVLGIAGFGYELFSSNGILQRWIAGLWQANPLLLVVMAGGVVLIKHWLERINPGRLLADAMVLCALLSGAYLLFRLFMA